MYQLIPVQTGLYKQRVSGDRIQIPAQKKNFLRFEEPHSYPKDVSPTVVNKTGAQKVRRMSVYTCSGMWCVCNVITIRVQGCGLLVM
jgi:hypothetical protein